MAHETHDLTKAPPTSYRRRDFIARAQIVLPIVGVFALGFFWLSQWLWHGNIRYSPGPLASVHSLWNGECAACHDSGQPLSAQNWFSLATGQTHVADARCQSCHAGPAHHANERAADVAACTACHRDHLGTPGKLLDVGDTHCVTCHRDLSQHVQDDAKRVTAAVVTRFAKGDHPEFTRVADTGAIRFNHRRHLLPGMPTDDDTSAQPGPFKVGDIDPAFRGMYLRPGQDDASPALLDCKSCHQTDARDFPFPKGLLEGLPIAALRPPRSSGLDMAPIIYEQHCKACHPLDVGGFTVKHRQQPKDALASIRGHFANQLLAGQFVPKGQKEPLRPGKLIPDPAAAEAIDNDAKQSTLELLIEAKDANLKRQVRTTCQLCHATIDSAKGIDQTIAPPEIVAERAKRPDHEPPLIPTVWFPKARFDHVSHRAMECRACHPNAYPLSPDTSPNPEASTKREDVLMPALDTCVNCHAPANGDPQNPRGGARFDCIACHGYHQADHPLAGRGSRAWIPSRQETIDGFLKGR